MPSDPCKSLQKMGYLFFDPASSAALKPCMWCKRALVGGEMCYKHQFYGIESHRCAQITPTLACNQHCLFCWRSFEHVYPETRQLAPEEIVNRVAFHQKKALAGYKVSYRTDQKRYQESLVPNQIAISLSGEPTLYHELPALIDLFNAQGCTTFLVSNGTNPDMLKKCNPYQMYVSLTAPDRETYLYVAQPDEDYWDKIMESLSLLKNRRSAIRITLVQGINDHNPDAYARMIEDSGARYVEVKGYMHVGYSQKRLTRQHMPEHERIRNFAESLCERTSYMIMDENTLSRVVCLERTR